MNDGLTVEEKLMNWCGKNGFVFIRITKPGDKFIAVDIDKKRTSLGYEHTQFDIEYVLSGGND